MDADSLAMALTRFLDARSNPAAPVPAVPDVARRVDTNSLRSKIISSICCSVATGFYTYKYPASSYLPKDKTMENNPLKQYFRQPAIYIRLPSRGQFYKPGALDMPANEEIPVLPMTTLDEITYRTPDALFNGSAVTSVIESCVPNIKDAWAIPAMDIDTILIAIRIATYGHQMDITTSCPACTTESEYGIDLRSVIEKIGSPDYTEKLTLGDLEITFCPMSYFQMNANSMLQFEDQKMLQAMQDQDATDEQRVAQLSEVLKKITEVTTKALAQSISLITVPTAKVTDQEHISEWLANCDRATFVKIRDAIIDIKRKAEIKPLKLKCSNCNHDYEQSFTLDMTTFFEAAS